MTFTHGNPQRIEKAMNAIAFYGMAGRGATAPGAVTLRKTTDGGMPYVVHFANTQLGGYHAGTYCETLGEAYAAFAERIQRLDPDGVLNAAFLSSGIWYTVVENSGYKGERDLPGQYHNEYAAWLFIETNYTESEKELLHVDVRKNWNDKNGERMEEY